MTATYCSLLLHPACEVCKSFVGRRSDHAHHWSGGGKHHSVLCGECVATLARAAVPILQAAEALGVRPTYATLADALRDGKISVLVQQTFG